MRHGYLTPPVLIGLTLICFLVAATIFFHSFLIKNAKNEPTSGPSPLPSASPVPSGTGETANWKTYTNSTYRFSIKYPTNWNQFILPDQTEGYLINVALTPQSSAPLSNPSYPDEFDETPSGITIGVLNTRDCTNSADQAQKELNDYLSLKNELYPDLEIEHLNLDKIYGYIIYKGAPGVEAQKGPQAYIFNCPKEIQISFDPTGIENADKVFNQILSTFKFTDQTGDGEFCGGIAGISCPSGFECVLDGNYPDAGGKCVKK